MRALEVQGKQEMALRGKPLPSGNLTPAKSCIELTSWTSNASLGIKHDCGCVRKWRGGIPDYEWRSILNTSSFAETIKVYDGYNSLRKRTFRTITVNKHCSKDELLLAAMRAFVVTQVSESTCTYRVFKLNRD